MLSEDSESERGIGDERNLRCVIFVCPVKSSPSGACISLNSFLTCISSFSNGNGISLTARNCPQLFICYGVGKRKFLNFV